MMFGQKAKQEGKSSQVPEEKKGQLKAEEEKQPKERKQKKQEATGSRWAAVVILVITVMLSLYFYWSGERGLGEGDTSSQPSGMEGVQFKLE